MARREQNEALLLRSKERTAAHMQCARSGFYDIGKRRLQILRLSNLYHEQAPTQGFRCVLDNAQFPVERWPMRFGSTSAARTFA